MANSGRKKYRAILQQLDAKGIVVAIIRAGHKNYNFIENGVITKNYKKRESCNKRLLKLNKNESRNKTKSSS